MSKQTRFIVIAPTGGPDTGHGGCRILPEVAIYPAIYSQVFGPDTLVACRDYVLANCGLRQPDGFLATFSALGGEPLKLELDIKEVEATGVSEACDFGEAFLNAVGNLPEDPNPYPDKLSFVIVSAIGGEFGGIDGRRSLVVTVKSYQ
jgi:hypothetical protein